MQNTSSKYKELVKQSGRTFKAKVICTFADGTQRIFTDSDIMQNGLKINDATSNEGSFDVGCAIIKELVLELDNSNKQLADIDFNGASFDVRVGLIVEQKYDGTTKTEWIKKGIYYAEEITESENFISIVAYDAMAKFDKPYNSSLKFPQMLLSIFSDACTACGVPYASLNFPNSTFYVQSKDFIDESATYRDIISYVAQLACCFARVDVDGMIHMRWYEETDREISERQKISGSVTVTCALITTADEDSKTYILGHSGYAANIEDNPLAQGAVNTLSQAFADNILEKTITPFEGEILSDPSIEAGDIVTIYDYSGNAYKTYITSVTFNIDNKSQIACDAETFNEKNRSGANQSATIIAMAKKQTEKQLSEYDIRVQQMNQLATNAMGYYETVESQDDGSIICYMHDKESLSDSKTIWKKTVDGIFISSDGGKTYVAGVDKNGNAVLKILATEGIVADWIIAGTLNADLIKTGTITSADGTTSIDVKNGVIQTIGKTSNITTKLTLNSGLIVISKIEGSTTKEIGKIGCTGEAKSFVLVHQISLDGIPLKKKSENDRDSIYASAYTSPTFRLSNDSESDIGAFYISSNGNSVLKVDSIYLEGNSISKKTATIDGTTIKYLSWE